MAEGLALAASVMAVIQVSDRVITLAKRYITDFREAPRELHAIFVEVSTLKAVFDSLHLSSGPQGTNLPQVPGLEAAVAACQDNIKGFDELLGSIQNASRLQWTLNASKARELLGKLSRCKDLVTIALSASTSNGVSAMQRQLEDLKESQISSEDRNVLDWLCSLSYDAEQDAFFGTWQKGTCASLLDSPEFRKWDDTSSSDRVILCSGMHGAGKTVFSSVVVDHLVTASSQSTMDVGVAYIYCNFKRRHEQKTVDLLSNILKQLAIGLGQVPACVRSLHGSYSARGPVPVAKLSEALRSIIAEYNRVMLVVDALDELSGDTLSTFIRHITQLVESSGLRFFATSRPIPDIVDMLSDSKPLTLEVRPTDDDVRRYIRANLPPKFSQGAIVEDIEAKLLRVADGMFLPVHLHLNQLRSQKNTMRLRKVLDALEVGSNPCKAAYEDTMRRIESQDEASRELAEQVIWWIACSKRRLRAPELQHAIAIFDGETCFEASNLTSVSDMVSVCAGLVTYDEATSIIRLVHRTAQDYLDGIRKETGPMLSTVRQMELSWTRVCIEHLLFEQFVAGPGKSDLEVSERLHKYPLLQYAAKYWGRHYRDLEDDPSLERLVKTLLKSKGGLRASVQIASVPEHRGEGYSQEYPRGARPLWVSARFNLKKTCQYLLDRGYQVDEVTRDGSTALLEAARQNSLEVMELLLEQGASQKGNHHRLVPVYEAARRGHTEAVVLLTSGWENIDFALHSDRTLLHDASSNGHTTTMSLLIARGADINAQTKPSKWTPLHGAISSGNVDAVRILLDKGADLSLKSSDGESPLHIATLANRLDLCRLLLDYGAERAEQDCQGNTPAHIAARDGFEDILEVLIEKGSSVQTANFSGATALHIACKLGREGIVLQLLKAGAQLDCSTFIGDRPLHLAAVHGWPQIVRALLDYGADINAAYQAMNFEEINEDGTTTLIKLNTSQAFVTALYKAERKQKDEIVTLLRERGAQEIPVDKSSGTRAREKLKRHTFHNPAETDYALIRLQTELDAWPMEPTPGCTWGPKNEGKLLEYVATIRGPDNTPYSDGLFVIDLTYPHDYPFKPIRAKMATRIFHPNINSYGSICLDILRDQWSPGLTTQKGQFR